MKKAVLGLILLNLTSLGFAQEKGISFEQGQTWKQIKAKAKAENKFIFLDMYAIWCVPCKEKDKNVYTSEKVGAHMNENFISYQLFRKQPQEINDVLGEYLEKNLEHPRYDINYLSWNLFKNSDDAEALKFACDTVMKYAIKKWYQNDPACYDTYANLLYRTGKRDQAIMWQEKAVRLSNNDKVLVEHLDKIKRGEKTWEKQ